MAHGQFLTFLIAITLLTIAPGADTIMVTRNSIRGGFKDGFVTSLGICSGLFVHATVSAAGVSLVLMGSANLFHTIKLIGAAYLAWMGIQSLRGAIKGKLAQRIDGVTAAVSIRKSLREGFLSNVLNPKTAVFYMAFLPHFMDPSKSPFAQAIVLAAIHFLIAMIWQSCLAAMVDKAKALLTTPKISRCLDGLVGSILVGFGVRLAFDGD